MDKAYEITIAGLGYVGMSLAVLLSPHHRVTAYDIDGERVAKVNAGKSTVEDALIHEHLNSTSRSLTATADSDAAFERADYVILATPTNYDQQKDFLMSVL